MFEILGESELSESELSESDSFYSARQKSIKAHVLRTRKEKLLRLLGRSSTAAHQLRGLLPE